MLTYCLQAVSHDHSHSLVLTSRVLAVLTVEPLHQAALGCMLRSTAVVIGLRRGRDEQLGGTGEGLRGPRDVAAAAGDDAVTALSPDQPG